MKIPIYQVDAFTDVVFGGNPAAVCPLESWLPDDRMQAIAAENNLSETAFFVPDGGGFALRWFTPTTEVDLCGHATLAAAFVLLTRLDLGRTRVGFSTRQAGELTVERDGDDFALDLPARPAERIEVPSGLAAALGRAPLELWRARKNMAVFAREADVRAVEPDLGYVARMPGDGLIVTAPGDEVDFVSRYFAPHAGIDEDPVTGSAHCTLAPFWAERLDKRALRTRQVSRRGGELRCVVAGDRVRIAGRAALYLEGTIHV